jgi:hypothetical protein
VAAEAEAGLKFLGSKGMAGRCGDDIFGARVDPNDKADIALLVQLGGRGRREEEGGRKKEEEEGGRRRRKEEEGGGRRRKEEEGGRRHCSLTGVRTGGEEGGGRGTIQG